MVDRPRAHRSDSNLQVWLWLGGPKGFVLGFGEDRNSKFTVLKNKKSANVFIIRGTLRDGRFLQPPLWLYKLRRSRSNLKNVSLVRFIISALPVLL